MAKNTRATGVVSPRNKWSYCWCGRNRANQLICTLSHYLQGFIHPRWLGGWKWDFFFHQPVWMESWNHYFHGRGVTSGKLGWQETGNKWIDKPTYNWYLEDHLMTCKCSITNHGDRKSPNWGCGTPSKWPKWLARLQYTTEVLTVCPWKGTIPKESTLPSIISFILGGKGAFP